MPELDSLSVDSSSDYDFGPDAALTPESSPESPSEPSSEGASGAAPDSARSSSPDPAPAPAAPPPKLGDYDVIDPVLEGASPAARVAEPAPAKPQKGGDPSPVSGLNPQQQFRAQALGLTAEQVGAFKDPEVGLLLAENVAWRTLAATRQQAAPVQQQQQAAPVQQPPQFNEAAARKQYADVGLDDNFTNALIERDKANHALQLDQFQTKQYLAQIHSWATGTQPQIAMQAQQHQAELINRDYEAFVAKQEPEVQKLLADPQTKAQIYQEADIRMAGMHARGIQAPALEQVFAAARNAVIGDKQASIAREQVRRDVKAHQGRAIARPRGADSPAAARVGSHANAIYARLGLPPQGSAYPRNEEI